MDEKTSAVGGDTHDLAHPDDASTTVFDVPVLAQLDYLSKSDRSDSLGRLGHYEILSVIGKGVAGLIFKAHEMRTDRTVALKPLAPELAAHAGVRERFVRAAQAAAALRDPRIVAIHAVENDGPIPLVAMELVEGFSLRDRIEQAGMLRLREILHIGSQIAAGLAAAHEAGLIHYDLKPANVLLEGGVDRVKIAGLGLASALDDVGGTRTGEVAGTPQYMSPERVRGRAVDSRSDLFSLGSVLYAMCTGRSPFRGVTLEAVVHRICDETPRPIHEVNPDIPPFLGDIINRLLAKEPNDRFQSAAEVAALLEQHLARLQPQPPVVEPASSVPPATEPRADAPEVQRGSGCLARGGAAIALVTLVVVAGDAVDASRRSQRRDNTAGIETPKNDTPPDLAGKLPPLP
ncbi:MAG: serine/threonine protein kinase [Planctomycetia bacterium]|nr:serine/threonine protein kinase [Planctomycetia bacterium]